MFASRRNLRRNEIIRNIEELRLIWLDENINDTDESIQAQKLLLEHNGAAHFYTDPCLCINFLKVTKNEHILFIASDVLAQHIPQEIYHFPSIIRVFILYTNYKNRISWIEESKKPFERFFNQDSLLQSVFQTINCLEKQRIHFSFLSGEQILARAKDSASFFWHRMLLYVLQQMPQDEKSKQEMIEQCQACYKFNEIQLKNIKDFQDNYNREKAIEWYTKDCFLYRLLNTALRTENIELLYLFRFYIIDLCWEIEQEYKKIENICDLSPLYRGQIIPIRQLEALKNNVGKMISVNGFMSASRDINVARCFTDQNNTWDGFCSVLFEITLDPSVRTAVFADIGQKSCMKDEKEVLFTLNSLFRILSVDFDSKLGTWNIKLITEDENVENVERHFEYIQEGIEYYSPVIYFGRILFYDLDRKDYTKIYFEKLLKSLPPDHPDIPFVYKWMGFLHCKTKLNLAATYYEKAYTLRLKILPKDHLHIANSLHDFAHLAEEKKEFGQALKYYEEALSIYDSNCNNVCRYKASAMKDMGVVYKKKGELKSALDYSFRALEIFQSILPERHPQIYACLIYIGDIYFDQGNIDKALDYYHKSLQIVEQCMPANHRYLTEGLISIINTYQTRGDTNMAIQFCKEKLDAQRINLGEKHPRLAHTLMIMSKVLSDKDPDAALQSYEEALSIFEQSYSFDHHFINNCLTSMSNLYHKYHTPSNKSRCLINVLNVHLRILPSDHVSIAKIHRNVALCYEEMNMVTEALNHFNESLSIYQQSGNSSKGKQKSLKFHISKLRRKL
ncbi:unnamed protein product [Adineta steineri]|uniref:NAD(P)(+)--arginine ADP-ribosyltransferase n=1 Tax=Adineta steineri TaxID=433720 RepID=A0A819MX00_9BILA|nr:unnamed protein product [Adineta steineri]CAF3985066.1 unnamed protein product [Adineta steineri]